MVSGQYIVHLEAGVENDMTPTVRVCMNDAPQSS